MSVILNIESSTKYCSIALHKKGQLIVEKTSQHEGSHFTSLANLINELFLTFPEYKQALTAIGISNGPGSYTGTRIGLATAQGIAQATNIPLIMISNLESLAYHFLSTNQLESTKTLLLVTHMHHNPSKIYYTLYDAYFKCKLPIQLRILSRDILSFLKEKTIILGNGVEYLKKMIEEEKSDLANTIKYIRNYIPSAKYMRRLTYQKYLKKEFTELEQAEPIYHHTYV